MEKNRKGAPLPVDRLSISCIALAAVLCIALLTGAYVYHSSHDYAYADLTFENFSLEGNRLTFRVHSTTDGEYIYRLFTSGPEDGKLSITLRGGKQPSLAQTPEESVATFYIDLPEGTEKVVCGKTTVYTVQK